MDHRRKLVALVALAALAAACGDGSSNTTAGSSGASAAQLSKLSSGSNTTVESPLVTGSSIATTSTESSTATTPVTPPAPTGATVTVSDSDNGKTVTVHLGDEVDVVLGSTYWQIEGSSDPSVLAARGQPRSDRGNCDPGVGCGTVSQAFVAVGAGTAQVHANRTTCGEALACRPDQSSYVVTISVTG